MLTSPFLHVEDNYVAYNLLQILFQIDSIKMDPTYLGISMVMSRHERTVKLLSGWAASWGPTGRDL